MPRNDRKRAATPSVKTRLLKKLKSSIGDSARLSHQTKIANASAAPPKPASIAGDVHPSL